MSITQVLGRVGSFQVCTRRMALSSHAGLRLVQQFIESLQVPQLLDEQLQFKARQRGYSASQTVLALAYNMISGGSCLQDLEVLRGDLGTQLLLGQEAVLAPTTAGEALRKFTLGDICDLQRVNRLIQAQVRPLQAQSALAAGVGPSCTIDLDSSIYEQASTRKQGSCKAYNGEIGYHPLLAYCAETGELLFSHLRRGSAHTCSKAIWFLEQTLQRVPEVSQAAQQVKLRADSGFYSRQVVAWCEMHAVPFAITADQTAPLLACVAALAESAWQDLERYGVVQVAQFRYQPTRWGQPYRYVVKRELIQPKAPQAGPLQFRYHVPCHRDQQPAG